MTDPDATRPLPPGPPDATTDLPPAPPVAPVPVPGCEFVRELGRGGMGVVYLARQPALHRYVAVKMILAGDRAGPERLARFATEAKAVAQLRHPNVVQLHHAGEADGRPYLILEYIDGGTLAAHLRTHPVPPARAAAVVEKLARAAHAAHLRGIVHRDLKPANVLLDAAGEPKITDFGLAKVLEADSHTATDAVLGTPSYMAPEQAGGRGKEVGPAADVYALGAILYELLAGRPPFRGETVLDTIRLVTTEDPVPPRQVRPDAPADLEAVCLTCLRKSPADRYADAEALAADLGRFTRGEAVHARPPGPWRRLTAAWAKYPDTGMAVVIAAVFWLLGSLPFLLFAAYLPPVAFAAGVVLFARPTGRAVAAAAVVVAAVAGYHLLRSDGVTVGVLFALGAVPAAVVGGVGRLTARLTRRPAAAGVLGAYFGWLLALPVAGCGGVFGGLYPTTADEQNEYLAAQALDQERIDAGQQPASMDDLEALRYLRQKDWTASVVGGVGCMAVAAGGGTAFGALLGGLAARRRA